MINTDDYYKAVGARIKEQREKMGLSQQDLAEKLECSTNTISNYETGKTVKSLTLEKMLEICNVLECDVSYLTKKNEFSSKEKEVACMVTGLSEKAVDSIVRHTNYHYFSFFDFLKSIDNDYPQFDDYGNEITINNLKDSPDLAKKLYLEALEDNSIPTLNDFLECNLFFPIIDHIYNYLYFDKCSNNPTNDRFSLAGAELNKFREHEKILKAIEQLKESTLYADILDYYKSDLSWIRRKEASGGFIQFDISTLNETKLFSEVLDELEKAGIS